MIFEIRYGPIPRRWSSGADRLPPLRTSPPKMINHLSILQPFGCAASASKQTVRSEAKASSASRNHQNSTHRTSLSRALKFSQGIRIRPSNYNVFYSSSTNESYWRRGENADFASTWGDVSGRLLFFDGSRSDFENLIFHF